MTLSGKILLHAFFLFLLNVDLNYCGLVPLHVVIKIVEPAWNGIRRDQVERKVGQQ